MKDKESFWFRIKNIRRLSILGAAAILTFFLKGCGMDEYQKATYHKGYESGYACHTKPPSSCSAELSKGYEDGFRDQYDHSVYSAGYEDGYDGRPYLSGYFDNNPNYKAGFKYGRKDKDGKAQTDGKCPFGPLINGFYDGVYYKNGRVYYKNGRKVRKEY